MTGISTHADNILRKDYNLGLIPRHLLPQFVDFACSIAYSVVVLYITINLVYNQMLNVQYSLTKAPLVPLIHSGKLQLTVE